MASARHLGAIVGLRFTPTTTTHSGIVCPAVSARCVPNGGRLQSLVGKRPACTSSKSCTNHRHVVWVNLSTGSDAAKNVVAAADPRANEDTEITHALLEPRSPT